MSQTKTTFLGDDSCRHRRGQIVYHYHTIHRMLFQIVLQFLRGPAVDVDLRQPLLFLEVLERLGEMPLPPYIREKLRDKDRYQTVYAKVNGSAAAPTAGLHFTEELLSEIRRRGVEIGSVTLHVGLGTFRPVREENPLEHEMHKEYCVVPPETAELVNRTRANGGRLKSAWTK